MTGREVTLCFGKSIMCKVWVWCNENTSFEDVLTYALSRLELAVVDSNDDFYADMSKLTTANDDEGGRYSCGENAVCFVSQDKDEEPDDEEDEDDEEFA
jgi:hypothetical protein